MSQWQKVGCTFQSRLNLTATLFLVHFQSTMHYPETGDNLRSMDTLLIHVELHVTQGHRKLTHIFLILNSSYDKYPLENK